LKPNDRIRCIKRPSNDIAQSFVQRYGTIVARHGKCNGVTTYEVRMNNKIDTVVMLEDEMIVVKSKPKRN